MAQSVKAGTMLGLGVLSALCVELACADCSPDTRC